MRQHTLNGGESGDWVCFLESIEKRTPMNEICDFCGQPCDGVYSHMGLWLCLDCYNTFTEPIPTDEPELDRGFLTASLLYT